MQELPLFCSKTKSDRLKMVVVIIMGVCGCGKTTVGEALAEQLGWQFRDADEFHSQANKRKMSSSIPLDDEDREPWLQSIHEYIRSVQEENQPAVLTCSALKRRYRDILRSGVKTPSSNSLLPNAQPSSYNYPTSSSGSSLLEILFVLLKGSEKILETRLASRQGHFMPPDLLTSQLAILEEPGDDENCVVVDIDAEVKEIVAVIVERVDNGV